MNPLNFDSQKTARVEYLWNNMWGDKRDVGPAIAPQWTHLACARFNSPHSSVSGLAYLAKRKGLWKVCVSNVERMASSNLHIPQGNVFVNNLCGFVPGNFVVHFPETQCLLTNDMTVAIPPSSCLQEDWYMSGMEFRRLHPAGSVSRLLRHPLRDRLDTDIAARSLRWRLAPERLGRNQDHEMLAATLLQLRDESERQILYPPNLAQIWRDLQNQPHPSCGWLGEMIERVAARWPEEEKSTDLVQRSDRG